MLRRELGWFGAMMMGLGSIVGTGVFVSIGLGASVAGYGVLIAIVLASLVALCNGLSSAQLAANHPVSGGTYEYGHEWLTPSLGFVAGWMFLCAKSASAAAAAYGFAMYFLQFIGSGDTRWLTVIALVALAALSMVVLTGIRRSSLANTCIVSVTLVALAVFIIAGFTGGQQTPAEVLGLVTGEGHDGPFWPGLLEATALMFVAYTGYGRIATMGEEVRDPRHTIPRAILGTLAVSMLIYVGVAFSGLMIGGFEGWAEAALEEAAPLSVLAEQTRFPGATWILALGAMTAMLGVLLNLLLGLSRVLLAMGRRGDMPPGVAWISQRHAVPWVATLVMAAVIGLMVALGDIRLAWSFSAFTVLIYYAITNLCALRLRPDQRLFPIWPAWCGLAACLFLAFWVDWLIWLGGLGLIVVGLCLRGIIHRQRPKGS